VFHDASASQLRVPFSGNDDCRRRDSHLCAVLMKFLQYLDAVRPFEAISLALEVSPGNTRARRLYEALGFRPGRIQLSPPRW
jgi:ribosomal protein S18 acetylase RimI-like enzyme